MSLCFLGLILCAQAAPKVTFTQSSDSVEDYDFIEITATVQNPDIPNPFLDASLTGSFGKSGTGALKQLDGFCDSADGTVFRIRFMPSIPGEYSYAVVYRQGRIETKYSGQFRSVPARRKGPLRVDPSYPWHFIWEGTGEHWWKTSPHDELVNNGCYCLAKPGELCAVYLPHEGQVTVHLEPGKYDGHWFNAFTGEEIPLPTVEGSDWTSPKTPGWLDWALLLKKQT